MKFKNLIVLLLITIPSYLYSQENNANELKSLKADIESHYYSFDYSKIKNLLQNCINLRKRNESWQVLYYEGFLHLVLGKIIYNNDKDAAYSHFDKSILNLERAFEQNPNSEIAALLSSAYGKKSSLSLINAFFLGMKAKNWIYKAHEISKESAKINLIAATHLMHLPSFYGGDKDKSKNMLLNALKFNQANTYEQWLLKWAEDAEIYAYLAQLEILKGNRNTADSYIRKALQIVPNYGFVLEDLIPQLKKL